jgi:purine nucleosidase
LPLLDSIVCCCGMVRFLRDRAAIMLPDEKTPIPSDGSALIIEEALRDDPRPLHVAFLGPLTDMASALLEEPSIAERKIRVVWIGGEDWPVGGWEYNIWNDINAANVVFRSKVELWQIPSIIYKRMAVSYAELVEKVYDKALWASTWSNSLSSGTPYMSRKIDGSTEST